jgi:hypothetical protein
MCIWDLSLSEFFETMFVVRCVEHQCIAWLWGLKRHDVAGSGTYACDVHACFVCLELQCNCNELNSSGESSGVAALCIMG